MHRVRSEFSFVRGTIGGFDSRLCLYVLGLALVALGACQPALERELQVGSVDRDAAPAGSVRVVLGADGTAHAAWLQRKGLFQHVASSRLAPGAKRWSLPVALEQDDLADSSAPELAIDAQGRVTAVWSGSRLNVWVARYE